MDRVFCPWRYAYITEPRSRPEDCVLCAVGSADRARDSDGLVVHRAQHHFIVMNLYPYTSGHVMIVPYRHVPRLVELTEDALHELVRLTSRAEVVLEQVYRPDGLNVGLNIGRAAGAGIAEHLHVHVVPRWAGDSNFMTVTGETRVLPEHVQESWRKLEGRF